MQGQQNIKIGMLNKQNIYTDKKGKTVYQVGNKEK